MIGVPVFWVAFRTLQNGRRVSSYAVGHVRAVNDAFDLLIEVAGEGELVRMSHGSVRTCRDPKRYQRLLRRHLARIGK